MWTGYTIRVIRGRKNFISCVSCWVVFLLGLSPPRCRGSAHHRVSGVVVCQHTARCVVALCVLHAPVWSCGTPQVQSVSCAWKRGPKDESLKVRECRPKRRSRTSWPPPQTANGSQPAFDGARVRCAFGTVAFRAVLISPYAPSAAGRGQRRELRSICCLRARTAFRVLSPSLRPPFLSPRLTLLTPLPPYPMPTILTMDPALSPNLN